MGQTQRSGKAVSFLHTHLNSIHTAAEWAETVGYSRSYFSVLIKQQYSESPYKIIKREKYKRIKQLISKSPEIKGKEIAQKAGFDHVENLYDFLRRDFDTNLTALRKRNHPA